MAAKPFWSWLFLCCVTWAQAQQIETRMLQNGMTVAYVQDTTRRMTHFGLTIRGGAALNPPGESGIAHLFEHHFWSSIDTLARQSSGLFTEQGVLASANTQTEHHGFFLTSSEDDADEALGMMYASLATCLYRPLQPIIFAELIAEIQAAENFPAYYLQTGMMNRMWQTSESAKDRIGKFYHIRQIDIDKLQAAIQPYLHPGNCLLSATGRKESESFFLWADSSFGSWYPVSAGAGLPSMKLPKLQKSEYWVEENAFCDDPILVMAWPVAGSRDLEGLGKLAHDFACVARTKSSAFYRDLVEAGRAKSIWWEWEGGYNPGQLVLKVSPFPDSIQACLSTISKTIEETTRYPSTWVTKKGWEAAAKQFRLAQSTAWDHSSIRLDLIGERWAAGDPEWSNTSVDGFSTTDKLAQFAKSHLFQQPHVAGLLIHPRSAAIASQQFTETTAIAGLASTTPEEPKDKNPATMTNGALGEFEKSLSPMRILFVGTTLEPDGASMTTLKTVASLCLAHPDQKLYVNGYSDGVGDGVKNYRLSIDRAQAVQTILVNNYGIKPERLIINPFGEAFAEFPDNTAANRHKNRRVTFTFAPAEAQPRTFLF